VVGDAALLYGIGMEGNMHPLLAHTIQYNTLRTAEAFLARAGVGLSRRVLVDFKDVVTICA